MKENPEVKEEAPSSNCSNCSNYFFWPPRYDVSGLSADYIGRISKCDLLLVTSTKLKQFQLEGRQWMVFLDQNSISAILSRFFLLYSSLCCLSPFIIKPTKWALEKHYIPLLLALTFASAMIPNHSSSYAP